MPVLDDRRRRILEAIIHCHILTAQPVGSRVLARKYNLGLSAATIRNAMADLEEMGYVKQPYTSAGRVPTELGYRYYVNSLMELSVLSEAEKASIRRGYADVQREFEPLMEQTSRILSSLSRYIGVVVSPELHARTLRCIELFQIGPTRWLAVLVIEPGIVRNRVIPSGCELSGDDLARINRALNMRFAGRSLTELRDLVQSTEQLRAMFGEQIFQAVSSWLCRIFDWNSEVQVYLQGTANMFSQPEFEDPHRVEAIFRVLEAKEQLSHLLAPSPDMDRGVTVRIGSEIDCQGMEPCSVISASYQWREHPLGTISVIGPTRMLYPRVMSIVDYTAKVMTEILQSKFA